mgnify:CR=1 FL=1
MEALEAELERVGYDLLLSGHDSSIQHQYSPRFLRQGKVDGIIMLGRFPRDQVIQIKNFGIPLIQLDGYRERLKVDYVTTDGYAASRQIVEHLVGLNHRRIIFVGYNHEDTNMDQREAGFHAAVETLKLPKTRCKSIRNAAHGAGAYKSVQRFLKSKNPPTALVAVNDTLALDLMQRLQEDGYAVPRDISIFGFNDDAGSKRSKPQISTIRINKNKLGQTGAKMIIKRIDNPDTAHQAITLPIELIHRDSVGPAKR